MSILPIGLTIRQVIDQVGGGMTRPDCVVINGGPMMGKIVEDLDTPLTKTTSAILVLPPDCRTVTLKTPDRKVTMRRARSVCCQCRMCSELCPRGLLGHQLEPHKSMRIFAGVDGGYGEKDVLSSSLCCDCGLCAYYACPFELAPNRVNMTFKQALGKEKIKPDFSSWPAKEPHEYREGRKVPTKRLIARMDIARYDHHLPLVETTWGPQHFALSLRQHIGAPAVPTVQVGDMVRAGDMVACPPEKALGAAVHTPAAGKVISVTADMVVVAHE